VRLLAPGRAGFIRSNFVHQKFRNRPNAQITILTALKCAGDGGALASIRDQIAFVESEIAEAELVNRLEDDSNVVVPFAAESHKDNSLSHSWPFIQTAVIYTYTLLEESSAKRCTATTCQRTTSAPTSNLTNRLAPRARPRTTPAARASPRRPRGISWCARAYVRSALRAAISECSKNHGPCQHIEKFNPNPIAKVINEVRPRLYCAGQKVRHRIHVESQSSALLPTLDRGRIGGPISSGPTARTTTASSSK
jgi:dTDP-glucose 4,6-dehydratase